MEGLVVGNEDCKIVDIVTIMMDSPTTSVIQENWRRLAIALDLWQNSWRLGQRLACNLTDFYEVFASLLTEWRSKNGESATLVTLIDIFSEHCKWKDLAVKSYTDSLPHSVRQRYDTRGSKKLKIKTFNRPPQIVTEFLKPENSHLLLAINTTHTDIVSQWICETVDNSYLVDGRDFVNLCYQKSNQQGRSLLPVIKYSEGEFKTLSLLSKTCRYKCIMVGTIPEDCAENESFLTSAVEIHWEDLTCVHQREIQDKIMEQLGIQHDESVEALKEMDSHTIITLIKGKISELMKCDLPDSLPYYIPRRVIPRHLLRTEVLGEDCVFLISGITRPDLRAQMNAHGTARAASKTKESEPCNETTETSGDILLNHNSSSRFIVLEDFSHLEKVIDIIRSRGTDIHYFQWQNEMFAWQRTVGSLSKLQKHIIKETAPVPESTFFLDHQAGEKYQCKTVIISDTPGMGKTVLLANLARQFKSDREHFKVILIAVSELVHLIKSKYNGNSTNTLSALLELATPQRLTRRYIRKNMNCIQHIFLDAFDELTGDDSDLGCKCLKEMKLCLPEATMWVTTRPHLLMYLERELCTLGYNIPALDKSDQINFLVKFWSRSASSINVEKATVYAQYVLDKISSGLHENEEQIAGIPLQCMLIGEIYEEQGLRYFHEMTESLPEIITITSLADLFSTMVHKKFENFKSKYKQHYDEAEIDRTHAYFSLQLIFPKHANKLNKSEFRDLVSSEELFNVGILASASVFPVPKFIHRTFAEYFVAKFVADSLPVRDKTKIHSIFIGNILSLGSSKVTVKQYDFGSAKSLKFPVICYFVNCMLMKLEQDCSFVAKIYKRYNHVKLNTERLSHIFEACTNDRFEYIYSKVFHCHAQQLFSNQQIYERILSIATLRASVSHAKLFFSTAGNEILQNVKVHGNKQKVAVSFSLLQVSILRGEYSLVEIFYNHNSPACAELYANPVRDLLHICIENTQPLEEKAVNDALQIFDLIKHSVSHDIDHQTMHPLDCYNIHPKIFFQVVEHFDLAHMGQVGKPCVEKTLFLATLSLNAEHYAKLMNLVESQSGNIYKTMINSIQDGTPLLEQIVDKIVLTEELLELILKWEPVIPKCVKSNTLLNTAIKSGKSKTCLGLLRKSFKYNSQEMLTTLKLLVERKQFDIIPQLVSNMDANDSSQALRIILIKATTPTLIPFCETLIANGADISRKTLLCVKDSTYGAMLVNAGANVNEYNAENKTPLHEALEKKKSYDTINSMILMGANVNSVDIYQRTPLMIVCGYKRRIVNILVQSGANVHARDLKGWTPLHHAAQTRDILIPNLKRTNEGLDELLLSGANPNAADNDGNTPLHLATNCHAVTALLDNGADTNAVNKDGNTPLHLAMDGYAVTAMVDKGADPNAVNSEGNTPLHYQSRVHVVTSLLLKGADPNARNTLGQTPLMMIKSPESISMLLKKDVDVNAVDKQGKTVFHHICVHNHNNDPYLTKILEILLKSGINPTSPSNMNDTMVYIFGPGKYGYNYVKYFKMLLSADISLSVQDTEGNTVFNSFQHLETVRDSGAKDIFDLVVELIEKGYFEQLQKPNASGASPWFHLKRLLNPYKEFYEKLVELEEDTILYNNLGESNCTFSNLFKYTNMIQNS